MDDDDDGSDDDDDDDRDNDDDDDSKSISTCAFKLVWPHCLQLNSLQPVVWNINIHSKKGCNLKLLNNVHLCGEAQAAPAPPTSLSL